MLSPIQSRFVELVWLKNGSARTFSARAALQQIKKRVAHLCMLIQLSSLMAGENFRATGPPLPYGRGSVRDLVLPVMVILREHKRHKPRQDQKRRRTQNQDAPVQHVRTRFTLRVRGAVTHHALRRDGQGQSQ